jgi:hypothetical protein
MKSGASNLVFVPIFVGYAEGILTGARRILIPRNTPRPL